MTKTVTYTDLLYEEQDGIAKITINRPEKLNAFRGKTCDELIDALKSQRLEFPDRSHRVDRGRDARVLHRR